MKLCVSIVLTQTCIKETVREELRVKHLIWAMASAVALLCRGLPLSLFAFSCEGLALHFLVFPCELPCASRWLCLSLWFCLLHLCLVLLFQSGPFLDLVCLATVLSSDTLSPALPTSPGAPLRPSFSEWLIGCSIVLVQLDCKFSAALSYAFDY